MKNLVFVYQVYINTVMHLIIFISEIFVFSGIALLLLYYQPIGFIIVSAVSFLVIGTYSLLTANRLVQLGKQRQEQDGLMVQKIQQGLGGIREIKIYNRESSFLNLFQKSNYKLYNISWLNQLIQKLPKAELHCHLDGSLRVNTIIDLANKHKIKLPTFDPKQLNKILLLNILLYSSLTP